MFRLLSIFSICLILRYSDARSLGDGPALFQAYEYILGTIIDVPKALWNLPKNKNGSLDYLVFTQKNRYQPCYLEPNRESVDRCEIDPDVRVVLLVCGFLEEYEPASLFFVMKNKILENGPATVIVLDWSRYNGPPVSLALYFMQVIGPLAADMMNFLIDYPGVKAENMILAGHSLGAHLVGYIGRRIPNLWRIDSLDPNWLFMETLPFLEKISYKDAKFVKVIHTSFEFTSFGTTSALGHVDFFVNGGISQPNCKFGSRYTRTSGSNVTVNNLILKFICPHEMMNTYYIYSMNTTDCNFLGTNCGSYKDFKAGKCPPNATVADMGFYGETVRGLPVKSKFYLEASKDPPYCLKNGYKYVKN